MSSSQELITELSMGFRERQRMERNRREKDNDYHGSSGCEWALGRRQTTGETMTLIMAATSIFSSSLLLLLCGVFCTVLCCAVLCCAVLLHEVVLCVCHRVWS